MDDENDSLEKDRSAPDWPLLLEDYPEALVRIATLRSDKQNHLIFAWIELYPFDMIAPKGWKAGETPWEAPKKPWGIPGMKQHSLGYSATRMPTSEALAWYFSAASGNVRLPGVSGVQLHAPQLAPEPKFGRFAVGREAPFTHFWHNGPRIHQLLPITPTPSLVQKLKLSEPARKWLEENLGFDPLAFDEWLGSIALVAPDPVCAVLDTCLDRSPQDGTENLIIRAIPRRTINRQADLSTLTVLVGERRAGAWVDLRVIPATEARFHKLSFPQPMWEIGHALVCSKRGLLRMVEPAHWLRSITTTGNMVTARYKIEVPARGKGGQSKSYEATRTTPAMKFVIGEIPDDAAADRLMALISNQKRQKSTKSDEFMIFGKSISTEIDSANFHNSKNYGKNYILEIIRNTRERVIFVDPYFGMDDIYNYALINPNIKIEILTGFSALEGLYDGRRGFKRQQGSVMHEFMHSKKIQDNYRIELRIMPTLKNKPIIHDRFIISDDRVYMFGPSFCEIGSRVGVSVRLSESRNIMDIIEAIWAQSTPLMDLPTSDLNPDDDTPGDDP